MSHLPYETWIFEVDQLNQEDRRSLQEHLQGCEQCQKLHTKWRLTYRELRGMPEVRPAPGFTHRWMTSLSERRAREQRKQAWRALLWFAGGAGVILLALVGYTLAVSSPADWLAVVIRSASDSLNLFDTLVGLVRLWIASTPLALNIALWIYLAVTLCLLSLGWVFALWRTSIIGVFNK